MCWPWHSRPCIFFFRVNQITVFLQHLPMHCLAYWNCFSAGNNPCLALFSAHKMLWCRLSWTRGLWCSQSPTPVLQILEHVSRVTAMPQGLLNWLAVLEFPVVNVREKTVLGLMGRDPAVCVHLPCHSTGGGPLTWAPSHSWHLVGSRLALHCRTLQGETGRLCTSTGIKEVAKIVTTRRNKLSPISDHLGSVMVSVTSSWGPHVLLHPWGMLEAPGEEAPALCFQLVLCPPCSLEFL